MRVVRRSAALAAACLTVSALSAMPAHADQPLPTTMPKAQAGDPWACVFESDAAGAKLLDVQQLPMAAMAEEMGLPIDGLMAPGYYVALPKAPLIVVPSVDAKPTTKECTDLRDDVVALQKSGKAWFCVYEATEKGDLVGVEKRAMPKTEDMLNVFLMDDDEIAIWYPNVNKPSNQQCTWLRDAGMKMEDQIDLAKADKAKEHKGDKGKGRGVSAKTGDEDGLPVLPAGVVLAGLVGGVAAHRRR